MEIKKISLQKLIEPEANFRPKNFDDFVWQEYIKKTLKAAIKSAIKRKTPLWHILFSGESWYWKTTLAQIIANQMWVNIKIVTWYAITKPAEIISILNNLEYWDILFIDEIHRLKPNIEEILYIAMEDFAIDMVMPEWWNVRIPINKFTLIGATTKLESLTAPLKNRFVYKLHFEDYTEEEKKKILKRYLDFYWVQIVEKKLLNEISKFITSTPREIHNFAIMLRDYLIASGFKNNNLILDNQIWREFKCWAELENWGLGQIHKKYIKILENLWGWPVWLKTIALKLGLNEKAVENDIEPLLLKLGLIEKTTRGRILKKNLTL